MFELLVILCIILVSFWCSLYNIEYKCPTVNVTVNHVFARVVFEATTDIDLRRLNSVVLDKSIPCGMYAGTTVYGGIILFVSKTNNTRGYIYSDHIKDKITTLDIWNLQKFTNNSNGFIDTYNKGCC